MVANKETVDTDQFHSYVTVSEATDALWGTGAIQDIVVDPKEPASWGVLD